MTKKMLTAAACAIGLLSIQTQTPALAQAKPPVTGDATNITQTSAVLSGTFYGGSGFASMGWGLAPKKYIANCGQLKPSGTQSCTAKALSCGTTYHYIATTAQNGTGADKSFKTAAC